MNLDTSNIKSDNEIDYELNMEKYRQLHNIVLSFSNNSIEIKKMCITTLIAIPTIFFAFFKDKDISIDMIKYTCYGLLSITILFYFVDVYTYYYQKKLRDLMSDIEYKIKNVSNACTENICLSCKNRKKVIHRLKISLFNWSNLIYYLLFTLFIIFLIIVKIYNYA